MTNRILFVILLFVLVEVLLAKTRQLCQATIILSLEVFQNDYAYFIGGSIVHDWGSLLLPRTPPLESSSSDSFLAALLVTNPMILLTSLY
jgi:hypothetical protein